MHDTREPWHAEAEAAARARAGLRLCEARNRYEGPLSLLSPVAWGCIIAVAVLIAGAIGFGLAALLGRVL
jgi:hypothetical protein